MYKQHNMEGWKNSEKVSKRQSDDSRVAHAERDEKAVDDASVPKRSKSEKDEGEAKDSGQQNLQLASSMTDLMPPSQMDVLIEKLINVEDISELLKVQQMDSISISSSPPAPAMISEGAGGKLQTVNVYWLDMCLRPGNSAELFVFGKVKSPPPAIGYSSCCVVVKNLERQVFLLPREKKADGTPVNYMDVYNEFYSVICPKYNITKFESKRSTMKYCFDIRGVPAVAEYVEVRYSPTLLELPRDLNGKTFSHAFGANTPLTETFLLQKKLKGPCWLEIFFCEQVQQFADQESWCKFEFTCDVSNVNIHPHSSALPPPTLVLASVNIQALSDDFILQKDWIIFAGVAVNRNFNLESPLSPNAMFDDFFGLLNKPLGQIWSSDIDLVTNERTLTMDSEWNLLECLVEKLFELDVDVYVCSNGNFQLFLRQILPCGGMNWSKIGRLKVHVPFWTTSELQRTRVALAGRLLCCVNSSTHRLIRAPSCNIYSLYSEFLGTKSDEVVPLTQPEIRILFKTSLGLHSFVKWSMQLCVLNIRLINKLQVMPLAVEISRVVGCTLYQTLWSRSSLLFECYLLHAFAAKDYILPDVLKPSQEKNITVSGDENEHRDPTELTHKQGFYDSYVLLQHFNWDSLLKSFTVQDLTTDERCCDGAEEGPIGIIRDAIRELSESRNGMASLREVDGGMEDQMGPYDIRQKALDWTIDLAQSQSCADRHWRFRSKRLQEYAKGIARDELLKMHGPLKDMGLEVIHLDDDSVMINTHSQDYANVLEVYEKIKQVLSQLTHPTLELGAVMTCSYTLVVRTRVYFVEYRPWSGSKYGTGYCERSITPAVAPIASVVADDCLLEIFSEQPLSTKIYKVGKILWDLSAKLKNGTMSLEKLLVTEKLAQDPEQYVVTEGLDHVTVALRINKSGTRMAKLVKGDNVPYLYCTDGQPHHVSEVDENDQEGVRVDVNYYLSRMVHPVVTEICEMVPELGFNAARVADALGLDSSSRINILHPNLK